MSRTRSTAGAAQRSPTGKTGPRGLGLALVARVVGRRGGTVTTGPGVEGTGTGFAVVLPELGRPARSGAREPVAHAPHGDHEAGDAQA